MQYLARLISITVSYSLVVAIVERAFTFLSRLYISRLQRENRKLHSIATPVVLPVEGIRPLEGFDYREIEPIKYRPFKNKRYVTMGISKSAKEDWIRIDRNYLDRINLRKQLLEDFPTVCMGDNGISHPAIRELYEEVLLDLLPQRYPSMFRVSDDTFFNLVTSSRHCISTTLEDPRAMLRQLGENVEEDFYLMVPNVQSEFVLGGCVACFPQGLHPVSKVGLSVSQIHEPVPGYEGRLKKGVNRCFERLEPGQAVGRLNWAIQCNHDTLFLPYDGANTLKDDDSPSRRNDVDPASSFLRCEHHTLTCLPRTGTIVFAVRTYLSPLVDIKNEGSGPLLAEACGSMPDKFGVYKNRPTWGQNVCSWLKDGGIQPEQLESETHHANGSCPFSAKLASQGTCPITH